MNEHIEFREKANGLANRFNASNDITEHNFIAYTEMPFLVRSYSFHYWPRGMKSQETLGQYYERGNNEKKGSNS